MTSNDPLLQPYVLKHLTLRNLHAAIYDALRLVKDIRNKAHLPCPEKPDYLLPPDNLYPSPINDLRDNADKVTKRPPQVNSDELHKPFKRKYFTAFFNPSGRYVTGLGDDMPYHQRTESRYSKHK